MNRVFREEELYVRACWVLLDYRWRSIISVGHGRGQDHYKFELNLEINLNGVTT